MVQVLVLGPIGVTRKDGRPMRLGSPLVQRLVGVLATEVGRPIGRERLIEVMWGDSPPDSATNNLQVYVSRLRNELGRGTIDTTSLGYALSQSVELDASVFERHLDHARSTDLADALSVYDDALALWQGPAFGALADEWWARPSATRLEELRLAAMAERIEVLLSLSDANRAVADSELLVAADPLKESSILLRMRALHLSGRSADALRVASVFRRRLSEQSGLSGSPALAALEQQILDHDPAAARPARARAVRGYVFGELLAEGAHGAVYTATQPSLGREVAIKVLRKGRADSPEFIRRFEAEAQLVARLEHPSIVPLYDYWREPGNAYLVLRLLRGGSLADRITRREVLPIEEIDLLIERVGDALTTAHGRGVVHRDVRAPNVLFDDEARPYLADFGIALADASDDEAADDVSALAAMILPLLQERSPLSGQQSILRRAANGEITTARELVAAWRASRELVTPTPTPERARRRRVASGETNPYVGLRTFDEADAALFFGRDHAIDEIVALVGSRRFVTIAGPSGAGKSSVVRAGVIPALREQGALITTMTPGTRPLYSLGIALRRIATEAQLTASGEDPAALLSAVAAGAPTVVVVDQLEELWTQSVPDDRSEFVKLLDETMAVTALRVVSTIRADFYDRPLGEPVLAPLVQKGSYALTALGAAELEAAITGPLARTGIAAEPGLVAQIIADVAGRPAPLPLLQFALASLYENRTTTTLTFAAYQVIGGVAGAIATAAEALYQQLTPAQQDHCRELFATLVTPGETGTDDTRRRALRSELGHLDAELVERLSAARLLTADRDPATGEPTIEIAHEALLTNWPRLAKWTDDQRDQLRTRRTLREDATAWDREARSVGYLYRGGRLDTALGHTGAMRLTAAEQAFLDTSLEQRRQELSRERRRLHRTQALLGATAALLVVALIAGSIALVQRRRANDQADVATAEAMAADLARMAAQSRADSTHYPDRAALLAVEAYRREPSLRSGAAIQSVLASQPKGLDGRVHSPTGSAILTVQFGQTLIAGRDGDDITIWSADSLRPLRTITDASFHYWPLALSGDDQLIASVARSQDRLVFYTTSDGRKESELQLRAPIANISFDPTDRERLAVAYTDGRFEVIRRSTAQVEVALRTALEPGAVAFSHDGRLIATSSSDGTLQVADARTGRPAGPVVRVEPEAAGAAGLLLGNPTISPDGQLVAAASLNKEIRVFRISDGTVVSRPKMLFGPAPWTGVLFLGNDRLLVPDGQGAYAFDIATAHAVQGFTSPGNGSVPRVFALSADGQRFALANDGPSLQVWNVDGRSAGATRSLPLPAGFTDDLVVLDRLSLSADLTQLLIYDTKGAYLYDLRQPAPSPRQVEFSGPGQLYHVAFTHNGAGIYSLHLDYINQRSLVQLWDPATLRAQRSVSVPYLAAGWIDVSPDLQLVAVHAATPELVEVYDFASDQPKFRFEGLSKLRDTPPGAFSYASQVAFSGDSKQLIMTGILSAVLADLTTGEERLVEADGASVFAAIDATGDKILTAPAGASPYVVRDATTLAPLASGFTGRAANRPQFNPTQPLVMTDGCCCKPDQADSPLFYDPLFPLEIWDATTGQDIGTTGWKLNCGFWYPNGKGFVGYDFQIEFWDLDPEQWVAAACRFAGRNLTHDEWDRYGPKATYRETCP